MYKAIIFFLFLLYNVPPSFRFRHMETQDGRRVCKRHGRDLLPLCSNQLLEPKNRYLTILVGIRASKVGRCLSIRQGTLVSCHYFKTQTDIQVEVMPFVCAWLYCRGVSLYKLSECPERVCSGSRGGIYCFDCYVWLLYVEGVASKNKK